MTKNGKNKTQQSKSERLLKVVENATKNEAQERMAQPNVLEVAKLPAKEPVVEDQKPVQAGDQTTAPTPEAKPKKVKKPSDQVKRWKEQKPFPMDWVITEVAKDNPKRKDAARRFAHYKNDQTVQEYTDICYKDSISKALAMADMRWDHVAGFVTIVSPAEAKK